MKTLILVLAIVVVAMCGIALAEFRYQYFQVEGSVQVFRIDRLTGRVETWADACEPSASTHVFRWVNPTETNRFPLPECFGGKEVK